MLYIRSLATLVSVYPPLRAQSASGSSVSSVHNLAQGFAPRPLVTLHRTRHERGERNLPCRSGQ